MNPAAERREMVKIFSFILYPNIQTSVPDAPKPVSASAIAVYVKFPNPSIFNTRMSEISSASTAAEMKKREI